MGFVYQFINSHDEIIYVGRTENIKTRIKDHFGNNGHIEKIAYLETELILVAEVASLNESRLYEMYYIAKLQPKYNQQNKKGGTITVQLPELKFEVYKIKKLTNPITSAIISYYTKELYNKLEWRIDRINSLARIMEMYAQIDDELFKKFNLEQEDEKELRKNLKEIAFFQKEIEYEKNAILKTLKNSVTR